MLYMCLLSLLLISDHLDWKLMCYTLCTEKIAKRKLLFLDTVGHILSCTEFEFNTADERGGGGGRRWM